MVNGTSFSWLIWTWSRPQVRAGLSAAVNWDSHLRHSRLMLVLCGSYIGIGWGRARPERRRVLVGAFRGSAGGGANLARAALRSLFRVLLRNLVGAPTRNSYGTPSRNS